MTGSIINLEIEHQKQTLPKTPKTTLTHHKTLRPCPNRVSDVVVKCHWYIVGIAFLGEGNHELS